jgi:hypothetical protein
MKKQIKQIKMKDIRKFGIGMFIGGMICAMGIHLILMSFNL